MAEPDAPKVLATQIDGKIRLTWQKPEPEGFWLEFEPVITQGMYNDTQEVVIPQDCNLHLTCDVTEGFLNRVEACFYTGKWSDERGIPPDAVYILNFNWYPGSVFGFYANEETFLRIRGKIGPPMPGSADRCGGTITIRLDDENGPIVAQFDFLHGIGV